MKKRMAPFFWGFTLLVLLLQVGYQSAVAFYQVDPMRLFVTVPKGRMVGTSAVTITNPGTEMIRLRAYTGYWDHDKNGGLVFMDKPTASSVTGSVRFNPREFEVPPGGKQVVRLAFPLGADAVDGEYHSIVYFEDLKTSQQRVTLAPQQKLSAVLNIKQQFAVVAYVYKGDLKPEIALPQYRCDLDQGRLKSTMHLENLGTRHYRGSGSFLISRSDTPGSFEPVQEIPLEGFRDIVVLPKSKIELQQVLLNEDALSRLAPGDYKVELNLAEKNNSQAKNIVQSVYFKWDGKGGSSIPQAGANSKIPQVEAGRQGAI